MTAPVLPTDTGQLGPGSLTVGSAGTEIDVSCYVNNAGIEVTKDTTDQTVKLCGTARPGVTTYTYTLTGNVDVDLANASGLMALSWDSPGTSQGFVFTPNTDLGVSFEGSLVIDPLNVQADEYGADLTSDFSWIIVGKPTVNRGAGVTGVVAGSPGSFQPSGVTPPANLAALKADPVIGDAGTSKPSAAWTTGQHVITGDANHQHWSGTAWVTGDAV